jgi:DNA transposition AAA+ family ATPase
MNTKNVMPAWHFVETIAYNTLLAYFQDARLYGNVFAITGAAGSGKTFAAHHFCHKESSVFHIECAEYWNKKMFLRQILSAMGKDPQGGNVAELLEDIVAQLLLLQHPLLILDEADKLNDQVLYFFITLYNRLKGSCGIVLMATPHLAKRIERGRCLQKKGYAEIYSRIGRRFIQLLPVNQKEVAGICEKNGLTDASAAMEIYNDCEGDLRRLEREIHKRRRKLSRQKN